MPFWMNGRAATSGCVEFGSPSVRGAAGAAACCPGLTCVGAESCAPGCAAAGVAATPIAAGAIAIAKGDTERVGGFVGNIIVTPWLPYVRNGDVRAIVGTSLANCTPRDTDGAAPLTNGFVENAGIEGAETANGDTGVVAASGIGVTWPRFDRPPNGSTRGEIASPIAEIPGDTSPGDNALLPTPLSGNTPDIRAACSSAGPASGDEVRSDDGRTANADSAGAIVIVRGVANSPAGRTIALPRPLGLSLHSPV
jgi:hypothetical protein